MSDTGSPRDGEELEMPEMDDEAAVDPEGLVIIAGGIADPYSDDDVSVATDAAEPKEDTGAEDDEGSAAEFTLDELVAEMAGVSAITPQPMAEEAASAAPPEHVDVLAAAMSDVFAGATPVEDAIWARAPFWATGAIWLLSVGVLSYLLWPKSIGGLESAPLYGVLVYGGGALVVVGLVVGLAIWSRARSHAEPADRAVVSRALLLRVLAWTAGGVALWVVSMIVLSLHHLDVL